MKPGTQPLHSTRLLDQLRERIRYLHYSLSTEKVYLYWVRFFIRWHGRNGQTKQPRTMGAPEIEAFLTMLATEPQCVDQGRSGWFAGPDGRSEAVVAM